MGTGAQTATIAAEEYLAWEREQPERHEWHAGQVFAMAGGSPRHNQGTRDVVTNPSLVVEVLSKNTEQHDRGLKWEGYRQIPSLTDYLLVSQQVARVETYTRGTDGWLYRIAGHGETIVLDGGRSLSVDTIFEGAFDLDADE